MGLPQVNRWLSYMSTSLVLCRRIYWHFIGIYTIVSVISDFSVDNVIMDVVDVADSWPSDEEIGEEVDIVDG